jgi:hypothetical protein
MSPKPSTGAPQPTKPAPPQNSTAKPVGLLVPAADVAGDTWTTRTIVRRVDTFRFYDPARYQANPKKLVYDKSQTDPANSACGVYDGYFHPQFDQFAELQSDTPGSRPTGPAIDPYDRSKDIQQTDECGSVSRT